MPVIIDTRRLDASIRKMNGMLRGGLGPAYSEIGRTMRNYVRATITSQGRKRPYAPLSWWTKQRTGRRKALITLKKRIKHKSSSKSAKVFFNAGGLNFTITQHHKGFTSPAVSNKLMVIPNPSGTVFKAFKSRKASKIPAREVWPTDRETKRIASRIFKNFFDGKARVLWR